VRKKTKTDLLLSSLLSFTFSTENKTLLSVYFLFVFVEKRGFPSSSKQFFFVLFFVSPFSWLFFVCHLFPCFVHVLFVIVFFFFPDEGAKSKQKKNSLHC